MGEKMKRWLCCWLIFQWFILPIQADNYVVIGNGEVIEEKNMHEVQSVASISKIMTALVAIENCELTEMTTISKKAASQVGSSVYLKEGSQVSLLSLLHGLMLRSGNDCAMAIAELVGGSEERFVEMMNEKAEDLGMKDSLFRNPSGLDEFDGGNLSSCYDMGILMQQAMRNGAFLKIAGAKYYTNEFHQKWKNKNRLLFEDAFTIAGKTGYTKQSGKTLVTAAKCQNMDVIVVSFRNDDYFQFHQKKQQDYFNQAIPFEILAPGVYQQRGHTFKVEEPIVYYSFDQYPALKICLIKNRHQMQLKIITKDQQVVHSFDIIGGGA